MCGENNTKPPYPLNDYPPTQIQCLSLTTRQHIMEIAQQAAYGQQWCLHLSSRTHRWWDAGSRNNHLNRRKTTTASINRLTVHADINLTSTDNNSIPHNFWAIIAHLICVEQETVYLFIIVDRGLVIIIKDISICTTSKLEFMIHTEVGKVLDARSVLARRYGRQEKGRRLYSVLARRKKGKEKISQIE